MYRRIHVYRFITSFTALLQKIQDGICLGMSRRRSRNMLVQVVSGYKPGAGIGRVETVSFDVRLANCGKLLLQMQLKLGKGMDVQASLFRTSG